ncbi:MAG: hypothetical protein II194_02245, partial [Bacteroidales bacterium]|nr:hypothetical protein [Bacteroidales bacterium]
PSELFKRAVEREGEARRLLIRNALETQNFEVAEAQIVAEREFEERKHKNIKIRAKFVQRN